MKLAKALVELERARADPKYAPLIALIKDVVQECLGEFRAELSPLALKKKKKTTVVDDDGDGDGDGDDGDDGKDNDAARYWVV